MTPAEAVAKAQDYLSRIVEGGTLVVVDTDTLRTLIAATSAGESDTVPVARVLSDAECDDICGGLSRILHEMAGAVSMCWIPRPSSAVFDSTKACELVTAAIVEIRATLATRAGESDTVPVARVLSDAECDEIADTALAAPRQPGEAYFDWLIRRDRTMIRAALYARPTPAPACHCYACEPHTASMRMIVCAICGNKRCPHAGDHRNACTNSNEPGQPGSYYTTAPASNAELDAMLRREMGLEKWLGRFNQSEYNVARAAMQLATPPASDEVRRLVAELEYWRHCMSYNDSYFGEPAGLVKRTVRALTHALANPESAPEGEP